MAPSKHEVIVLSDSEEEEEPPPQNPIAIEIDEDGAILILSDSEDDGSNSPSSNTASKKRPANAASASKPAQASRSIRKDLSNRQKSRKTNKRFSPTSTLTMNRYSDSEESDRKPAARPTTASRTATNNNDIADSEESDSSDDDNGVEESDVAVVSAAARAFRPNSDTTEGMDDDGCFLLGSTGTNTLTDFPHSRENCVIAPMASADNHDTNRMHCPNCYCYVCDVPVQECTNWRRHCHARHKTAKWQKMRGQVLVKKKAAAPAAAAAATPDGTAAVAANGTVSQTSQRMHETLRVKPTVIVQLSVPALLQEVTSVYPSEVTPPGIVVTPLKHHQKQSLAFMQHVEQSQDPDIAGINYPKCCCPGETVTYGSYGGWLSDEVGMGKTLVVIALAASDGGKILPSFSCNKDIKYVHAKTKTKATVVVTSVSLMGQWEDEVRKHAPGLTCYRFHKSKSKYGMNLIQGGAFDWNIKKADIIVTSGTFKVAEELGLTYSFNRVVVDEAHLLCTSSMRESAYVRFLFSERRWCVTATPASSCPSELWYQCAFLGVAHHFGELSRSLKSRTDFFRLVVILKKMMARHTKDQKIQGGKALALPKSTSHRTAVVMSAYDRRRYEEGVSAINLNTLKGMRISGSKFCPFQFQTSYRLFNFPPASKVRMLLSDLKKLQKREPDMRVVVFTQYRKTHAECVEKVARAGIEVLQFSGSTQPSKRDDAIRQFQSTGRGPKAFIITLRSGSVGMTLTAASRAFLMDPCIDPATEIQAAGRINRLGQTSRVKVVKYFFVNTMEDNIIELHRKISLGEASLTSDFIPSDSVKILTRGL